MSELPQTKRGAAINPEKIRGSEKLGGEKRTKRNAQETRRKLMGATVASLYERGYGGLSTVDVARRARVSRGGQLHHFPHKQALLAETVAHLFERRLAQLRVSICKLPAGGPEQRLAAFIDASWPAFNLPTFYAWLELVVASRTDDKLRRASGDLVARFRGAGARLIEAAVGPETARLSLDFGALAALVFGNMEALAVNRVASGARGKDHRMLPRLESLKTASALYLRHLIDEAASAAAQR